MNCFSAFWSAIMVLETTSRNGTRKQYSPSNWFPWQPRRQDKIVNSRDSITRENEVFNGPFLAPKSCQKKGMPAFPHFVLDEAKMRNILEFWHSFNRFEWKILLIILIEILMARETGGGRGEFEKWFWHLI